MNITLSGLQYSTDLFLSGPDVEIVVSGGVDIGMTVGSGATQEVFAGAAQGTTILDGGAQYVAYGGKTHNTVIRAGGVVAV